MENRNTFGSIRLHKETIDKLKQVKRETENKLNRDLTWDDFFELISVNQ